MIDKKKKIKSLKNELIKIKAGGGLGGGRKDITAEV